MASWHQSKGGNVWTRHATEWTMLHNPPGEFASGMRFHTEAEAKARKEQWEANGRQHLFILPPSGVAA